MIPRRLVTEDGVTVTLTRARAYRDGRPAALLVHGAFANHRLWLGRDGGGGGFAHYLTDRGVDVWLADLRHHGASDREPEGGHWRFEDWIRYDATTLVQRVLDETDGAPLFWVGHSAAGAVGLCWAARYAAPPGLAGVVTLGTPGPHRMGYLRRPGAQFMLALTHVAGRFPARALRLGPEDEAPAILTDWLGWNVRGAWVGKDGFDYLAALAAGETPVLSLAGSSDHFFAPPWACEQLVQAVGERRAELAVCEKLTHRGLVRDTRARERCWPRVAQWIEDTLHSR